MSTTVESTPTFAELNQETAALNELRRDATTPDELAIVQKWDNDLGQKRLAKEANTLMLLDQLAKEEQQRTEGMHWQSTK